MTPYAYLMTNILTFPDGPCARRGKRPHRRVESSGGMLRGDCHDRVIEVREHCRRIWSVSFTFLTFIFAVSFVTLPLSDESPQRRP